MTVPGVTVTGPPTVLASRYDVTGLAAEAVAWAASGAAELLAARNEEPPRAVTVDRLAACAAFAGERLLRPIGWTLPPIWDPLAGDYRTADGWVRLHTNYPHHRAAVLAGLDLRADRDAFLRLVRQAHVLVCGLRSGALDRLGLSVAELRSIHPGLITARLNAYGWSGPWTDRRGFDSLVQMSCGIAYLDEDTPPSPLPVQALDHATGYALAGWIGRSLAEQLLSGRPSDIRTSLVATAAALTDRARPAAGPGEIDWPDTLFETTGTAWGPVRRVRVPGAIEGVTPRWAVDAGPLGRHRASFG